MFCRDHAGPEALKMIDTPMRTLPDHRDPALDDYGPALKYYGIDRIKQDLKEIREQAPKEHNIVNICNALLNVISYMERTYEQRTD